MAHKVSCTEKGQKRERQGLYKPLPCTRGGTSGVPLVGMKRPDPVRCQPAASICSLTFSTAFMATRNLPWVGDILSVEN